jgi:hypothetical protein
VSPPPRRRALYELCGVTAQNSILFKMRSQFFLWHWESRHAEKIIKLNLQPLPGLFETSLRAFVVILMSCSFNYAHSFFGTMRSAKERRLAA